MFDGRTDVTIIIQSLDVTWIFKLARNFSNQLKFPMSMFYSSCSRKITALWSSAIVLKASHSLNMSLVIGTSCSCSGQYYVIRIASSWPLAKKLCFWLTEVCKIGRLSCKKLQGIGIISIKFFMWFFLCRIDLYKAKVIVILKKKHLQKEKTHRIYFLLGYTVTVVQWEVIIS